MSLRALQGPTGGGAPVGGSGTTNTIPRWTGPSTLGDSALVQSGTNAVGFGTPKTWGTNFTLNAIQLSESASLSADINTTYLAANQYWDSPGFQNRRIKANFAARYLLNGASGDHQFQIAPFGAADSVITWSTAMTILNTSGNVGIGTASPGSRLTVAGTGGTSAISMLETGVRNWAIRSGGAATNIFDIADLTAGFSRLAIDSTGNVGIGTASPGRKLEISASAPLRMGTGAEYFDFLQYTPGTWAWLSSAGQYVASWKTSGGIGFGGIVAPASNTVDVSTASWGLKLPATPGNADTQTLDAYQEIGTGTPAEIALTLTCGTSGTITVNAASSKARVTRVGNKVIGHGRIVVSSVSAPLGRLSCVLTGCPQPFTNFLVETQTDNTTGLATGNRIVGTSDTAATPTLYFDRYSPNTSSTDAAANIQAGTIIVFNICYSV